MSQRSENDQEEEEEFSVHMCSQLEEILNIVTFRLMIVEKNLLDFHFPSRFSLINITEILAIGWDLFLS